MQRIGQYGMLQVFRVAAEVSQWIDAAVAVRLGLGIGVSRFPALPHAMLTMRLAKADGHAAAAWSLCPPITFHTLTTEPVAHVHGGGITALGLLVRPEAAACLLGETSGVVVNQVLSWEALAGASEAARLEEAIHRSYSDVARIDALIESFGRTMSAVSRGRDQAYSRLCAAIGRHGALAGDELGIGRRQLERRCQAVLGLAPKQFQRVLRFHRALSMAVSGDASRLTNLAFDTGFYDQSHLARDARMLAGAPLGHLQSQARPDMSWWPLATRVPRAHGRTASDGPGK